MDIGSIGYQPVDAIPVQKLTPAQRGHVVRYICGSQNATDAALILNILGLDPQDGRP